MNKTLIISLAALALLSTAIFFVCHHQTTHTPADESVISKWQSFKSTYGKKYSDPDFEAYRIQVFANNLKKIEGDSTRGITQFMDLTTEEFKSTYLTLQTKQASPITTTHTDGAKNYVDWVKSGKVSHVKDQGQCGSCWAFSTTGSVESALILAGTQKQTVDLSEQELVDCSTSYGNNGCGGGLMDAGMKYIQEKGLGYEKDYKYTATDGTCKDTSSNKKVSISAFADVSQGNCNELKTVLANQPVSIAVNAESWQFYTSGVLTKCGMQLDHGVLLVGFVKQGRVDAWKVKNSWGPSWGQSGFIYLADGNTCGLCNMPTYPTA